MSWTRKDRAVLDQAVAGLRADPHAEIDITGGAAEQVNAACEYLAARGIASRRVYVLPPPLSGW